MVEGRAVKRDARALHAAQRADIVGMGCHAGINGLRTAAQWAEANPGRAALLVCVEVCFAACALTYILTYSFTYELTK